MPLSFYQILLLLTKHGNHGWSSPNSLLFCGRTQPSLHSSTTTSRHQTHMNTHHTKQVTWVLLLKANFVVGCVAWLATVLSALLGAIKKRMIHRQGITLASEKAWERGERNTLSNYIVITSNKAIVYSNLYSLLIRK